MILTKEDLNAYCTKHNLKFDLKETETHQLLIDIIKKSKEKVQ